MTADPSPGEVLPDRPPGDVLPDEPPPDPPRPWPARVGMLVAAGAVGLLIGVLGAFVQADRWLIGTTAVPWGAALALVTLVLCVRGAAWGYGGRVGGAVLYAGWLVATVALSTESGSGDLALSGGTRQVVYLFGGVIAGAAAATVPLLERRGEAPAARVHE